MIVRMGLPLAVLRSELNPLCATHLPAGQVVERRDRILRAVSPPAEFGDKDGALNPSALLGFLQTALWQRRRVGKEPRGY
jgi:hypothetical protein